MGKVSKFPQHPMPVEKPVKNSIEYPKRVTIDSLKGTRTSDNVVFTDVMNLCLGAIVANAIKVVELSIMDYVKELDAAPEMSTTEDRDKKLAAVRRKLTEHMYDQMNSGFAYALEMFAPDIAQHPGLTDLAVMKAEDEIIAAYLAELPEAEREAATVAAQELREASKRKLLQMIADKKADEEAIQFTPLTEEELQAQAIIDAADREAYEKDHDIADEPEIPTFSCAPTKEDVPGGTPEVSRSCPGVCPECTNDPCLKA